MFLFDTQALAGHAQIGSENHACRWGAVSPSALYHVSLDLATQASAGRAQGNALDSRLLLCNGALSISIGTPDLRLCLPSLAGRVPSSTRKGCLPLCGAAAHSDLLIRLVPGGRSMVAGTRFCRCAARFS